MSKLLTQKQLGEIKPEAGGYAAQAAQDPIATVEVILTNVLTVFTVVGGVMFTLYFLMGGLNWVSAGGDKGKIEKAKGMLINSAIGLIVIVLSYSITYIVGKVLGIEILSPAKMIKDTIKF